MKQSVFEEVRIRWMILKANTLFSFKESVAYSLNNWGGLASTTVWMLTYLMFLSAIFGRVREIAGYNYSEVLMLTLVSQLNFYLAWIWSIRNMESLGEDVKSGNLDLILVKPLPALWYVTFKKVNLFMLVFEMWPATLPLIYMIWKNTNFVITGSSFLLASLVFVMGHITLHCFQFLFILPSFKTGEYRSLGSLSYQIGFFGDSIPLEAYPKMITTLGLTVVPFLLHTGLTASFLLGKTTDVRLVLVAFLAMVVFLFAKTKAWNTALRYYSSASS